MTATRAWTVARFVGWALTVAVSIHLGGWWIAAGAVAIALGVYMDYWSRRSPR